MHVGLGFVLRSFRLEDFCVNFFSRVFCTCDFSCCVLVLACLLGTSHPVDLLLYVYVHVSAEMLFILFKDFNCFLFIPLSCFIFMFCFFFFPHYWQHCFNPSRLQNKTCSRPF